LHKKTHHELLQPHQAAHVVEAGLIRHLQPSSSLKMPSHVHIWHPKAASSTETLINAIMFVSACSLTAAHFNFHFQQQPQMNLEEW
jgi:hypothetical protein